MVLLVINKYIKIYLKLLKFAVIVATNYRASFFVEVLVELLYTLALLLFFRIIYFNLPNIAGWTLEEMLFLFGINIITSEAIVGGAYVFNLNRLPVRIKDGEVDFAFLKPISSLFNLSLGRPYISSFISIIPGFYLIGYSLQFLMSRISLSGVLAGTFVMLCGIVIYYSILVIIASFSFVLINTESLIKAGLWFVEDFKAFPHGIYRRILQPIFFYILPVVFISSIPASTVIKGIETKFILLAPILSLIFLLISIKVWNIMTRFYTSASS